MVGSTRPILQYCPRRQSLMITGAMGAVRVNRYNLQDYTKWASRLLLPIKIKLIGLLKTDDNFDLFVKIIVFSVNYRMHYDLN